MIRIGDRLGWLVREPSLLSARARICGVVDMMLSVRTTSLPRFAVGPVTAAEEAIGGAVAAAGGAVDGPSEIQNIIFQITEYYMRALKFYYL
ncbi:hypothetical protein GCK72_022862 [Caenorhabditis remanei]|uniref:Uncharacterized protein n=1 Tax=Caenorhabditis remanei TaxID=31234 RepID=A0A6A5FUW7_CAERE|nr:hypothetical protein GCK72_022862 [Caenorhabditis remanei]KAF1746408.1 hypothetical protein GCK72_022862 [Caenorhabditis remanei]